MSTTSTRAAVTAVATLPFLGAVLGLAPGALASTVESASFGGGWTTKCTLPIVPGEGPQSGPYTCNHTAKSVHCAAVVDTDTVNVSAKVCRADLVSGKTTGYADLVSGPPYPTAWTCANGAGTGTFVYRPSTSESTTFTFPVTLTVEGNGSTLVIAGSYVQSGTGRTVVVRATMPAACSVGTSSPHGYSGTVAPQ